jgi:hypothetical protein
MYPRVFCAAACLGVALFLSGCTKKPGPNIAKAPTYPAKAHVTLNGAPATGVQVRVIPKDAADAGQDPNSIETYTGLVNKDGNVEFATYDPGDGLPEGEYALTFTKPGPRKQGYVPRGASRESPLDQLAGKYDEPKETGKTLTVKSGDANDAGNIELTVTPEELAAAEAAAKERSRMDVEDER